MGAALRVGSRHDTATPAAPPTPRPEAPRGADARPGAGALVRAAAGALAAGALYTLACPPHEWSLLAWLVPGLLLVAVRRLGIVRALACGALFGVAIGYGITGWAFHAALEYFAFNRPLTAGFVLAVWLFYSGVPNALLCAAYVGLAERVPGWARGPLGAPRTHPVPPPHDRSDRRPGRRVRGVVRHGAGERRGGRAAGGGEGDGARVAVARTARAPGRGTPRDLRLRRVRTPAPRRFTRGRRGPHGGGRAGKHPERVPLEACVLRAHARDLRRALRRGARRAAGRDRLAGECGQLLPEPRAHAARRARADGGARARGPPGRRPPSHRGRRGPQRRLSDRAGRDDPRHVRQATPRAAGRVRPAPARTGPARVGAGLHGGRRGAAARDG